MPAPSSLRGLLDLLGKHLPSNAARVRCQRAKGVRIGTWVYLGYDANIDTAFPEMVEIGDHARIGIGAIILAHSRPADAWMAHLGEQRSPVRIGRHVAIYPGAIIMPGVTVGECAIVREGAVVVSDVPAFSVVAGSPATVVETLPREKAQIPGDTRKTPPV